MPSASKIVLIRQLVEAARNNLDTATQLLKDLGVADIETKATLKPSVGSVQRTETGAVIIEGVFDGQNMVGPDGKLYSVPANYASKSKLVEGDLLKLTISPDGSFIYKQIGPMGDEVVVLVPKGTPSSWAAVENVIKKEGAATTPLDEGGASAAGASENRPEPEVKPAHRPRGRPRKMPAIGAVSTENSAIPEHQLPAGHLEI
ncbi:MAG: 50S ribosomal protein L7/L12 [Parcubacteria group bacterium GW2011_GWA2_46_39]|nr:MAG: 50S ribosomal protein L7/L12 [Parcubacteria group bacterium GW2011_GWA2_46_39]